MANASGDNLADLGLRYDLTVPLTRFYATNRAKLPTVFKAIQTGGPSGGCLPASMLELPVEYESLTQAGAIMGSGGMVVLDEDTDMVKFARVIKAANMKLE